MNAVEAFPSDAQSRKQVFSEIEQQLQEIRRQKGELAAHKVTKLVRSKSIKSDYTRVPKKKFSHPKLKYVYGDIAYSPYTIAPTENYPSELYRVHEAINELKKSEGLAHTLPEGAEKVDMVLII